MAELPSAPTQRKTAAYGDLIDLYAARASRARTMTLGADRTPAVVAVGRGATTAAVRQRVAPAQPMLRRFRVAIAGAAVAVFGVVFAAGALAAAPVHSSALATGHAGIIIQTEQGR